MAACFCTGVCRETGVCPNGVSSPNHVVTIEDQFYLLKKLETVKLEREETPEEKAKRIGVPLIPKIKWWPRPSTDPNPTVAVCGECGLELKRTMGYVCPRSNCPTGLGSPHSFDVVS